MISIATTYFNRKAALWKTLKTLEKSSVKDFELVIVDDGSAPDERIEDFARAFNFMRLLRIEPEDKDYINPCVPFNLAIAKSKGDIIILQAPECLHVGDILSYVSNYSEDNQYLVFSCYSLGQATDNRMMSVDFNLGWPELEGSIKNAIGQFRNVSADKVGRYDSWYAHPVYRKAYFNFIVSMPMKDMRDLGGFDERYAKGHAADDRDLVSRIFKKKMDIKIVEHPWGIHQYHPTFVPTSGNHRADVQRNNALYAILSEQPHYKVKNSFLEE